jgi:hypothetical protein
MLDAFLFEIAVITVHLVPASVMLSIGRLFAVGTGSNIWDPVVGFSDLRSYGMDRSNVRILVSSSDPWVDSICRSGGSLYLSSNV